MRPRGLALCPFWVCRAREWGRAPFISSLCSLSQRGEAGQHATFLPRWGQDDRTLGTMCFKAHCFLRSPLAWEGSGSPADRPPSSTPPALPDELQVHTVANSQTQVKGLSMHTHASTIYKDLIQLNSD